MIIWNFWAKFSQKPHVFLEEPSKGERQVWEHKNRKKENINEGKEKLLKMWEVLLCNWCFPFFYHILLDFMEKNDKARRNLVPLFSCRYTVWRYLRGIKTIRKQKSKQKNTREENKQEATCC